ncbi:ATP-binding protein [Methanobrevibacter curvatus]|uniref:DeoR-like helix-turn-helix domain protein n=1 Tax=Methanobrevibacter curvatus TaxID=49547 RepID=A0A165ZWS0_9EURY|nr:ATP-binding protein [Methanobrevibacter curvatus]KZX11264.1 DeoR-like helix-turn-helix domain protein [Methanobrevibacter curvatus]
MSKLKIFVSSNQAEFENERVSIKEFIENNLPYSKLFDVFIFEDVPADGRSPNTIYSNEVLSSDIFIGLIGQEYGKIQDNGISASEYEFDLFINGSNSLNTFMFILEDITPDEKTKVLIEKAHKVTYNKFSRKNLLEKVQKSLDVFISNRVYQNTLPFDERTVEGLSLDDIDINQVNYFLKKAEIKEDVSTDEELKDFLANRAKVVEYSSSGFKISNAGILFFAKNPSSFIQQHEVKIARFQGRDKVHIIDSREFKYPMPLLLDEIEIFVNKQLKVAQKIDGFRRTDIPEYPYDALREAIVNALAHRDYDLVGASVSISIFVDRIEITSPGNLIPPLKISSLEGRYSHRNGRICELFHRTKDMEKYGTGIGKMNTIMKDNGMKKPEFRQSGGFFDTIFYGRTEEELMEVIATQSNTINLKELGLNDRQIVALTLIVNEGYSFSINRYMEHFGVSKSTAIRDLNKLSNNGLVYKFHPKYDNKHFIFSNNKDQ